tara:strand:+ start:1864 stop:2259 length:396 start_codon:yes stop_codon:yes gene_type:complete
MILGGAMDEFGCCVSCGYTFCPSLAECLRPWERICPTQEHHRLLQRMDDFNLSELGIFIGVCSSALVGFLLATQKSKCQSICWGMCKRDVKAVIEEERLEMTGHTGTTPRIPPRLDLELNNEAEPQAETKI